LAVAQCEQDVAEERLQEAREAALSELHGRVQGRALALITSAELRDAGFVDADPLTERALFGLAEWAASAEMTAASSEHDPLAVATEAWTGVLDVRLTVDDTLSWRDRMRVAPFLQDALVNAVGHGRAQAAHVSVTAEAGELLLTVVDDGAGPAGGPAGLGLRRVESAGGDWHLHANTSGGTRLDVRLPGAQGKPGRRDSGTPPTTTAL
jgi:two-component sensor histidine kinase